MVRDPHTSLSWPLKCKSWFKNWHKSSSYNKWWVRRPLSKNFLNENDHIYEEQLTQFRQAHAGRSGEHLQVEEPAHTGAPFLNDDDDPYPIYGEEEVESDNEDWRWTPLMCVFIYFLVSLSILLVCNIWGSCICFPIQFLRLCYFWSIILFRTILISLLLDLIFYVCSYFNLYFLTTFFKTIKRKKKKIKKA